MTVEIETVTGADPYTVAALTRLLPQLSSSAAPLDHDTVVRVLACDANTVLVARDGDGIVGMLTLVMFPLPSGLRARIEDVVVEDAARGRGVGGALTEAALRLAR